MKVVVTYEQNDTTISIGILTLLRELGLDVSKEDIEIAIKKLAARHDSLDG